MEQMIGSGYRMESGSYGKNMGKGTKGRDALGRGTLGRDAKGINALGKGKDALGRDALSRDTKGKNALGKNALGKSAQEGKAQEAGGQTGSVRASAEEDSFAARIAEKLASSPAEMTLAEYKLYFYDKVNALYMHPSQKRAFWYIDITDAAYRRMQSDPQYEQRVLDYLEKNRAVNYGRYSPQFIYVHIEDTWEKCYGYSLGRQDNDRYAKMAERRRREAAERAKKARKKKLLKEYLLKEYLRKRAEQKRILDKLLEEQLAKQRLERTRLLRMWDKEQRMRQAARAYEASLVMLSRREGQG